MPDTHPIPPDDNKAEPTPPTQPTTGAPEEPDAAAGATASDATPDASAKPAPKTRAEKRASRLGCIAFLVGLLVLGALLWKPLTGLWVNNAYLWLHSTVGTIVVLAVAALVLLSLGWRFAGARIPLALLLVGGTVAAGVWLPYATDRAYMADTRIEDSPLPQYRNRAAFVAAERQAEGNRPVEGSLVDTTFSPLANRYESIFSRPGRLQPLTGYAAVMSQEIALTGQATGTICEIPRDSGLRLDGFWHHSLERAIVNRRFGVDADQENARGTCVDGTAHIIVPLTRPSGFPVVTHVPAGVAVYDTSTDELSFRDDVAAGDLPGAGYPVTLAARQREATKAGGTLWEYWTGRAGWSDTSGDEGDPNAGNTSEFLLARADEEAADFVTPLNSRGRGGAITAVSSIDALSTTAGERNPLVLHRLEPARRAGSAVVDRLRTDYSDLPDWASGLTAFEMVPSGPDEWVVSLGQKQNVAYLVRVKADGSSCLETADGQQVRCGRRTAQDGNGPGVDLAPGGEGDVQIPADGDLSELTDAEIARLQQQVADEVTRRLNED